MISPAYTYRHTGTTLKDNGDTFDSDTADSVSPALNLSLHHHDKRQAKGFSRIVGSVFKKKIERRQSELALRTVMDKLKEEEQQQWFEHPYSKDHLFLGFLRYVDSEYPHFIQPNLNLAAFIFELGSSSVHCLHADRP